MLSHDKSHFTQEPEINYKGIQKRKIEQGLQSQLSTPIIAYNMSKNDLKAQYSA